ncbi:hypothetical protein INQ41_03655 [Lysobacter ciconiae]|uniref:Uncharacterized protein n=1 Tax=Novilysobacter ciconiae TaxID=2781022 RepID=A0A7S6UH07_9GAMM|nr:hypothetical protein [Lysobacter ciconiae]QOW20143.1 hypothetical protein INQ41_03655 [Lysobacter ciconiae]
MTTQSFRFNPQFFQSRMRAAFEPRTPRNGVLRFLMRALGLGVLVALVVLGAVVGVTLLAVGQCIACCAGAVLRSSAPARAPIRT